MGRIFLKDFITVDEVKTNSLQNNWTIKKHIITCIGILFISGIIAGPIVNFFLNVLTRGSGDAYMFIALILYPLMSFTVLFILTFFAYSSVLRVIALKKGPVEKKARKNTYFQSYIFSFLTSLVLCGPAIFAFFYVSDQYNKLNLSVRTKNEKGNYEVSNFTQRVVCDNPKRTGFKACDGFEITFLLKVKEKGYYNIDVYVDEAKYIGIPLFYPNDSPEYKRYGDYYFKENETKEIKKFLVPSRNMLDSTRIESYSYYLHFWKGDYQGSEYDNGILFTGDDFYKDKTHISKGGGFDIPLIYDSSLKTEEYPASIYKGYRRF
jgi:hypothetical protein